MINKITNIRAAKKLIVRFRSITKDEIEGTGLRFNINDVFHYPAESIMLELTGMGRFWRCPLCIAVGYDGDNTACSRCILSYESNVNAQDVNLCYGWLHYRVYIRGILNSKTAEELIKNLNLAADILEQLATEVEIYQSRNKFITAGTVGKYLKKLIKYITIKKERE